MAEWPVSPGRSSSSKTATTPSRRSDVRPALRAKFPKEVEKFTDDQGAGGVTATGMRPATAADEEYCFQLHKAAMGAYIAQIWGWDEDVQRGFHTRAFSPGRWQIITVDSADAGMLHVERRHTEIYLARIELHPDYQGRGIGSRLIHSLLQQARRRGQDLTLDVLAVNQRAHALYRRMGLHEVARHGENDIKIRMSTKPPLRGPSHGS
ncbi:GNAT family N-acetyltransferase [Streptomyces sp. CCNWLW230]|uniref:GNAT family N-acetyltransferase n=2 Tax=Streptomyces TaxID=1883 RepID=UPI003FD001C1